MVRVMVRRQEMKISELFESKPKDMADWSEDEWADWDAKMERVKKKAHSGDQETYYNPKTRKYGVRPKKKVDETATAGATSAANIGTVDAPQLSPGKSRGKKSYTGSVASGSGTKSPPQPKVVQPKTSSGTAVNALDMKGSKGNLFGSPLKR